MKDSSCQGSPASGQLPVYPSLAPLAQRLVPYPIPSSQAPPKDALAMEGFFYAGYADCVRCFYCGVGLKSWKAGEDVWEEQAGGRPLCGLGRWPCGPRQLQSPRSSDAPLCVDGEIGPESEQNRAEDAPSDVRDTEDEELAQIQNEIRQLEEENRRLQEQQKCRLCRQRDAEVLFLPCGHLVACVPCAAHVHACPICQGVIEGRVSVLRE